MYAAVAGPVVQLAIVVPYLFSTTGCVSPELEECLLHKGVIVCLFADGIHYQRAQLPVV